MKNEAEKLAKFLLEINAVKLNPENPFDWTSGIQSPIYCDNRLVLSYPEVREFVKITLAEMISKLYPEVEVIAGIATGGISHGALAADYLKLPGCYVRPEPKKHGLKNQIEGIIRPGQKVALIEDLISTGKSSVTAIQAVKDAGGEVLGLLSLFDYEFEISKSLFFEAEVEYFPICGFGVLCNIAAEEGFMDRRNLEYVLKFAENPQNWRNNAQLLAQKNQQQTQNTEEASALGHS